MDFRSWLCESNDPLPDFIIWSDGAGHKIKGPGAGHTVASFHYGPSVCHVVFSTTDNGVVEVSLHSQRQSTGILSLVSKIVRNYSERVHPKKLRFNEQLKRSLMPPR